MGFFKVLFNDQNKNLSTNIPIAIIILNNKIAIATGMVENHILKENIYRNVDNHFYQLSILCILF